MASVLIRGGTLIDGTGAPGVKKDVLIKDAAIVRMGALSAQHADTIIDAAGCVVAPGFIDVNTDSDHYLSLFTDPAQQDFLLQGVTTILGGHCGSSLAPLVRGNLDAIRKWADVNVVNVDWHTFKEFLAVLERLPLGVNFGSLVGHATIRRGLIGDELRDLTVGELEMMNALIEDSLAAGAFGVSTGLAYNHARNTPYAELVQMAKLAARFKRVYATHVRHEHAQLVGAITEALSLAADAQVKTCISHLRSLIGFEKEFEAAQRLIAQAPKGVMFDAYPFNYSIVPLYTLLPEWAQQGSLEQMRRLIEDDENTARLIQDFKKISGETITIAGIPGFDYLVGKTLTEYAAAREQTVAGGLYALMREVKLKAVCFKRNINAEHMITSLFSDRCLVASNSPSLLGGKGVLENERAAKTFTTFIDLALARGIPLEAIIHKITAVPAAFYGIPGRGILAEGAVADLVVLRDNRAAHVLVGGVSAVRDGALQNAFGGKVLRAHS